MRNSRLNSTPGTLRDSTRDVPRRGRRDHRAALRSWSCCGEAPLCDSGALDLAVRRVCAPGHRSACGPPRCARLWPCGAGPCRRSSLLRPEGSLVRHEPWGLSEAHRLPWGAVAGAVFDRRRAPVRMILVRYLAAKVAARRRAVADFDSGEAGGLSLASRRRAAGRSPLRGPLGASCAVRMRGGVWSRMTSSW